MSRKYRLLVTRVLLTIILGFNIGELAIADNKSADYGSKGMIGFYGEYVFESSEALIPPQTEKTNNNKPVLPQTGVPEETGTSKLLGLFLLGLLLTTQTIKVRRASNEIN